MNDENAGARAPANADDEAALEPAPAEEEGRLGHTGPTHDDVKTPKGGVGTPSRRRIGEDPFGRPTGSAARGS